MPLPRKYKKKYPKNYSANEQGVFFALKVVVPSALFLLFGIGIDIYRFLH